MRDLQTLRDELDGIDREIVALFARRMAVCDEVADYKAAHGLGVPDASREKESSPPCAHSARSTLPTTPRSCLKN